MHILHGSFARYPRIIGHEFAGEIEAVGPNVSGLAEGDRVVVDPVGPHHPGRTNAKSVP